MSRKTEKLLNTYLEVAVLLEQNAEQNYKLRANMIKVIQQLKACGDDIKNQWLKDNEDLITSMYDERLDEAVHVNSILQIFMELGDSLDAEIRKD